jgi:hypothetical protein
MTAQILPMPGLWRCRVSGLWLRREIIPDRCPKAEPEQPTSPRHLRDATTAAMAERQVTHHPTVNAAPGQAERD